MTIVDLNSGVDPYLMYARLREAGPVHAVTLPGGVPVWLVTRFEDVRAGLADPRLSLSKRHAKSWTGLRLPPALDANLLNMDPPGHTRLRRLVSTAFTPRRVEELRPRVQMIADELLDAMQPRGQADLVASFAAPLPITVICELLGIPATSRADFRTWSSALLSGAPDAPAAVANIVQLLVTLIRDKREAPGDDLLSAMVAARSAGDGDRLSEDELTSLAFLVLFAGYENSVNLIANGALALLRHPDRLGALHADPALIETTVEEVLRYDSPAPLAFRRFPVVDIEIGGVVIPAGETVLLGLASANRDPARFDEPDDLVLDRADVGHHLAFGHGLHYCLGAGLARLEGVVALGTLLRRYPDLRLAVPETELSWLPAFRTRSLRQLPVAWTAGR